MRRPITITSLLAVIALAVLVQNGNGPALPFFIGWLLIYGPYNAIQMIRRPEQRTRRCVRLIIWTLVALASAGAQMYWFYGTKNRAEEVLQGIQAFREKHGAFPPGLADAGMDAFAMQSRWHIRYSLKDGRPRLTYPATLMWLGMNEYDFDKKSWRAQAD